MEPVYDMWTTGIRRIEIMSAKFMSWILEKETQPVTSFVMSRKEAKDYRICKKLYIPQDWENKITVEITDGTIFCCQREPYQGLRLLAVRGEISYRKAEEVKS